MRPARCSNHTSDCEWRRVDSSTYRASSAVTLRLFATSSHRAARSACSPPPYSDRRPAGRCCDGADTFLGSKFPDVELQVENVAF